MHSFLSLFYYSHAHEGPFFLHYRFRFPKCLYPLLIEDLISCLALVAEVTDLTALAWGRAGPSSRFWNFKEIYNMKGLMLNV